MYRKDVKGEPARKSIIGPQGRNGINSRHTTVFLVDFSSSFLKIDV